METLNVRAGFLCNHEVLTLLQAQRDSRTKEVKLLSAAKQARVAKLGRKPYANEQEDEETHRLQPTELHTVTFECIKYLEESVHPIRRQTSSSISKLLKALKSYDLTKAERLSIVNLAPLDLVHIVVCVEDFESRFPSEEDQEAILALVRDHLAEPVAPTIARGGGRQQRDQRASAMEVDHEVQYEPEEEGQQGSDDEEFVHEGLGGGGREVPDRELDEQGES